MACAVAEGAKSAGAEVTVKRVPDLVPEEVAKSSNSNSIRKFGSQPSLPRARSRAGSPFGAPTITAGDGFRQPSAIELDGAEDQAAHVAKVAAKLG
jgi:hypothetical protein